MSLDIQCAQVLDDETECPNNAEDYVTVKDKLGTYDVALCRKHKAERNNKAARYRVSKK